ncbi:methyl-CpG-binding domain-containing protein 11-like [Zingiber officinale]|uniref:methyl-CpG-binding domain-containing protein 11-like n=1 Tax=Zingiber officinale TaxID=94328 RepID=UPI001C4B2F6C|nr:methyl-CpG-binding domain-containing protein 11-like [Zingiber officinale]
MAEAEAEVEVGDASAEKGAPTPPDKARADDPEVVCVELPAPAGWTKKFLLNEDASPRKNEIVFISPTGEEIKNKRHLQQYLKSHPGGPPSSEFDWGTGDTPRRSARIKERAKPVDTPEDEKPKKRERKSSSKKATRDKKDNEDRFDATSEAKENVVTEEAKASTDVEMLDTEDENKVKAENENKVNCEALTTGTEVNEVIATEEIAVNEDTSVKVVNEGADEPNSTLETGRNVQEKTAANLGNNDTQTATEADKPADSNVSLLPDGSKNWSATKDNEGDPTGNNIQEDSVSAVPKDVPSGNSGDAQHLPKASPIKT